MFLMENCELIEEVQLVFLMKLLKRVVLWQLNWKINVLHKITSFDLRFVFSKKKFEHYEVHRLLISTVELPQF